MCYFVWIVSRMVSLQQLVSISRRLLLSSLTLLLIFPYFVLISIPFPSILTSFQISTFELYSVSFPSSFVYILWCTIHLFSHNFFSSSLSLFIFHLSPDLINLFFLIICCVVFSTFSFIPKVYYQYYLCLHPHWFSQNQ